MSEQAGSVLQAQPVAAMRSAAAAFPARQAREMQILGGGGAVWDDASAFAPLSGGPGTVSSQDQKLRRSVECAAVAICLYTVVVAVGQVVGIVAVAEMIKEKLTDLEQFHNHAGFSWVVKALPTVLTAYLVPFLAVSGSSGLLYATCGCCAARANNSACAFCFCCCSAWQTCGLCLALLTSLPTVSFLSATAGVVQSHLELCDPSVCLQSTTDWPSNGQEDARRAVDCLAQATWHDQYKPAYPQGLSGRCSNPLFLHCDHDYREPEDPFKCSSNGNDTLLRWTEQVRGTYYVLAARGAPCPCNTKPILDLRECMHALRNFPKQWPVREGMMTNRPEVHACFVREMELGRTFLFGPICDPKERRAQDLVCVVASPKARDVAADRLRDTCDDLVEEDVASEGAPAEAEDAWMPALYDGEVDFPFATVMPPEPLRSCKVNDGGIELWQLTREEAPRALRALQAMNLVRIVLLIPAVVLFGVAFWFGQLLWKQVTRPDVPIQQPLLPPMAARPQEVQAVQQPLMVAAPAVPGTGGV